MAIDDLNLSLLVLVGLRLIAFIVFAELYLQKRENRYAFISLGWLLYMVGPLVAIIGNAVLGQINYRIFNFTIALGSLLLLEGLVLYYHCISLSRLAVLLFTVAAGLGVVSLLLPQFIHILAVAVQFGLVAIVLVIVLVKRKWFISVGGRNSYLWLMPFLILTLVHAFGFNFFLSSIPLSLRFYLTYLINLVLFVFLLHFDKFQSSQQLQASEERYRQLFQNANECLFVAQQGRLVFFNDMTLKTLGYSASELRQLELTEFIHEDDREMVMNRHLDRIQGKQIPDQYQFRVVKKDKQIRWGELNSVFIEWEGEGATLNFMTDVTERKKAEEMIRTSLKEKTILIDEIHHRVKNNMQVIASLLRLQMVRENDQRIKNVLRENQGRVYAMSAIHESLYQSEYLSEIDFRTYLARLLQMLLQTYSIDREKITYEIDSPDIKLGIETANPLSLVLSELISNSLKYAFPDSECGRINITMRKLNNSKAELIVKDDGIGMPEYFDWEDTQTLGLQLVRNLVEVQLGGSIELSGGNGTQYKIQLSV